MIIFMDHKINFAFLFRILAYLMLEIVKQDKCPKYSWSSKLLFPAYHCVQPLTVSTLVFDMHLFNFPLSKQKPVQDII